VCCVLCAVCCEDRINQSKIISLVWLIFFSLQQ
jgi:hypothetical protein